MAASLVPRVGLSATSPTISLAHALRAFRSYPLPSGGVENWYISVSTIVCCTMTTRDQIKNYITSYPEPKRSELQELHRLTLHVSPKCKLWFEDGKNSEGKTVSNPNIGYGSYTIKYADGKTREFFQIGISANTTGISVYVLGLDDKTYLAKTFGKKLGKASVTGYCIKFKTIKDINLDVLEAAIRHGFAAHKEK